MMSEYEPSQAAKPAGDVVPPGQRDYMRQLAGTPPELGPAPPPGQPLPQPGAGEEAPPVSQPDPTGSAYSPPDPNVGLAWQPGSTAAVSKAAHPFGPASAVQDAPQIARSTLQGAIRIGLWGSTSSGKTTYLAALRHAVGSTENGYGSWTVTPVTAESGDLMFSLTSALNKGLFPEASTIGSATPLQWMFSGDISKSRFAGKRERLRRRLTGGRVPSEFVLDLIDVSGVAFSDDPEAAHGTLAFANTAVEQLLESHGLIYLFDPLRERDHGDALQYVNRTIVELKQRYFAKSGRGGPLPHQVSVCITKFDHADLFQQARKNSLVYDGPDGIPRVRDEHAQQLFEDLCTGQFWGKRYEQGDRSAFFVMQELQASFKPENIKYFVTSSIGFYKPPGWRGGASVFDPADFSNYRSVAGPTGKTIGGIRGAIHPINVLEPLISLQQRIKGSSR
jgi:hypothetical protein